MPTLTVQVSAAMDEAVRLQAKAKKVTISDVIVGALRTVGYERDDVLEALQDGRGVEIDVRRRSAASTRDPKERIREYVADKGCVRVLTIHRHLHIPMADVQRSIDALTDEHVVHEKPFDRPRILHWTASCKCKTALAGKD